MPELITGTPATDPQGMAHFTAAMLQACLGANRVSCMVALAWDGPSLWAFSCALGLGERPAKVEALADALAVAAGADSCRVSRAGGKLIIEVPKPPAERKPLRAARLDQLAAPGPMCVPIGITTGGNPAWLDLADPNTCHVIIGGATGSGKTVALHWLLYRLLRQNPAEALRLLALDPKKRELAPFAKVPHLLHAVASTPLEISRLLAWATAELDRRTDSGRTRPRLLIVAEELADVLGTSPGAGEQIARLAQLGRGLGVTIVGTTQQPGARSLGDALPNFPARLIGRIASATLTFGATGKRMTQADQLIGKGDFLLITGDGTTRLQVPLISGKELGTLPHVAEVPSLADELPAVASFADLARDSRGGYGRRELTAEDYREIDRALASGASIADLRQRWGLGFERARRLHDDWGTDERA